MNEEPPTCFLGCCNVRSWTLAVAIINIVILALQLVGNIMALTVSPEKAIFSIIICILVLYVNIKLRSGVIKHEIDSVRLWLKVYFILFICSIILIILCILLIAFVDLKIDIEYRQLKENLPLVIILFVISEGIVILWYYPVYQYYKFEKTYLQRTVNSGLQPV